MRICKKCLREIKNYPFCPFCGASQNSNLLTLEQIYSEWSTLYFRKVGRKSREGYENAWRTLRFLGQCAMSDIKINDYQLAMDALQNKDYKITNAEWTGSWEAMPGADMMSRSATFTISCYTTGWIAQYEEAEDAERTGTVSASYSFVDSSSVEDGMYHWLVTAHYKPASIWTVLQTAAAVLGIGLLIAALVLILFILSRKRKAKKRTTEKA